MRIFLEHLLPDTWGRTRVDRNAGWLSLRSNRGWVMQEAMNLDHEDPYILALRTLCEWTGAIYLAKLKA